MGEYISVNPWNGKELRRTACAEAHEIDSVLNNCHEAFKSWQKYSLDNKLSKFKLLKQNLETNYKHYALIITQEMGKLITEAEAEILKCARLCDYYISVSQNSLGSHEYDISNARVIIRKRSQGIVLGIMPWNFPFWQVFRFAIPNLIIGNSVIVKHASNVPGCAELLQKIFESSGFTNGLFTNVYADYSGVERIIADDRVSGVSLTGSESAGRVVGQLTGRYLKKSVLELGGNNAFLVLEDASIKKAVKTAVPARLINAGQSCIASKRFLIHKSKENEFIERLIDELEGIKIQDPILRSSTLAPMASSEMAAGLQKQIENSISQGANLISDLKREEARFDPCILNKVKPGNEAFQEELFGPVFSITTYKSHSEAVKLINSSRFGLGATIISKNIDKASELANQLDEGSVYINSGVFSDPAVPFGGTKNSGYGREMALEGLLEFANIQPLVIAK